MFMLVRNRKTNAAIFLRDLNSRLLLVVESKTQLTDTDTVCECAFHREDLSQVNNTFSIMNNKIVSYIVSK